MKSEFQSENWLTKFTKSRILSKEGVREFESEHVPKETHSRLHQQNRRFFFAIVYSKSLG